ncbi:MAG: hypothetical protein WCL38_05905, partial [Actinomycetota bacterium]
TSQTIHRLCGGRDGAFSDALKRESESVQAHREVVAPGAFADGVKVLVEHYEVLGDDVVRMLAAESGSAEIAAICESGRRYHQAWCKRLVGTHLRHLGSVERQRRLVMVGAVLDVYMWKLLRRDGELTRIRTEQAMVELLETTLGRI